MGKRSRDKGVRSELACRDFMRRRWPGAYRVGTQMPVRQPDIDGTPYWIESKSSAGESGLHPWAALHQAQAEREACHATHRPIVVYLKADRKPAVVMMLADEWLEQELKGSEK